MRTNEEAATDGAVGGRFSHGPYGSMNSALLAPANFESCTVKVTVYLTASGRHSQCGAPAKREGDEHKKKRTDAHRTQ